VRVEVRLFATLRQYLPSESRNESAVLDVPDGSSTRDVTRRLGIPVDLERVVLVNGRDTDPDAPLTPHDVITLFPPLAGGQGQAHRLPSGRHTTATEIGGGDQL
jgi:molybdopterin converting factor small subunit